MKKPWSDLPNAQYINWVLNSLKENPELWDQASDEARDKAWDRALAEAAALAGPASDPRWWPRYKVWHAARDAAPRHWADGKSRAAAWGALVALVAYDDCDQYLNMGYEELKMYAVLSEKPQAVLLLPIMYVQRN